MTRPPLCTIAAAASLAACGSLWPTLRTTAPAERAEVLACADAFTDSLGYRRTWTDGRTGLDARKQNLEVRPTSWRERNRMDVLAVRLERAGEGGTRMSVEARSFSEETTERGPTTRDEHATDLVQAHARALLDRCGGEVAPGAS
jgi:hypothetical protein